MRPALSLVFAAVLAFGTAQAQDTAPPANDDWGGAEITITAHFAGPALWRVRKGQSEVYIVGGLPVMLKRFDWDRARIGRILDRSNVLLTSPQARGGPLAFTEWQLSKGNGLFRTLYDELPPALGGRFWKTASRAGLDPQAYAKMSPVYAVMKLREDIYEKRGLSANDPEKMLIFMARDRKTPMKPVASYSAASLIGKLNSQSKPERYACVAATLNEIDFAVGHVQAATDAWKTGDLKGARDNSPTPATLACLEGSGKTSALLNQAVDDTVKAVNDALQKPGKSVVVFPLSILLRPNGALDQLRAEGAEVSEPEI